MFHYILTIDVKNKWSDRSNFEIDCFLKFNENERLKVKDAIEASKDFFWKTSYREALNIFEVDDIPAVIYMIYLRTRIHNSLMLYYTSEIDLNREEFQIFVKHTPIEKLMEARYRGRKDDDDQKELQNLQRQY